MYFFSRTELVSICALCRQMSGPSDGGSGLDKNNDDIIDNGVHNFDFDFDIAHDHDGIQAQEHAQILTNSVFEKKYKNGDPLLFNARTSPVLYTTSDTSKIQLLKLCSQAEVPLYFFESVLKNRVGKCLCTLLCLDHIMVMSKVKVMNTIVNDVNIIFGQATSTI